MAINYYLQENLLSKKENAHAAHIKSYGTLDVKGLIRSMAKRGTTFSEHELESFLILLDQTVCDELADGNSINLPFMKLQLSVGGIFESMSDQYDPQRHKVRATLRPGPTIKKSLSDVKMKKVIKPVAVPLPLVFTDINSGVSNSIITRNGIGAIKGTGLRFSGTNPEQGVYFISEDRTQVVKVELLYQSTNLRTAFMIPDLPSSTQWRVEVRVAYGRNGTIIRQGMLPHLLHTE